MMARCESLPKVIPLASTMMIPFTNRFCMVEACRTAAKARAEWLSIVLLEWLLGQVSHPAQDTSEDSLQVDGVAQHLMTSVEMAVKRHLKGCQRQFQGTTGVGARTIDSTKSSPAPAIPAKSTLPIRSTMTGAPSRLT